MLRNSAIQKRCCRKMKSVPKHTALTAIAAKYLKEYTKERQLADDEGCDVDTYSAFMEACSIDSAKLRGASKQRFEEQIGIGKFQFDFGDTTATADIDRDVSGAVKKVTFCEDGVLTPIDASELDRSDSEDSGSNMVAIRIETGKGGRQLFFVPKGCEM